MPDLATLILIPVAVVVIGLIIEYWIIQPIRKRTEIAIPSSRSINKDWAIAIRRAIRQFKAQPSDYNWKWWSPGRNRLIIEAWKIEKGQATLTVAVSEKQDTVAKPVPGIIQFVTVKRIIARYELIIDRIGEVLKVNSIIVDKADQLAPMYSYERDLPETRTTVKRIKQPSLKKSKNGDVKVIIQFEIENTGKAGKVCPYIEFQVVEVDRTGKLAPQLFRSEPEAFDIPAMCVTPFRFEYTFHAPEWPLIQPPNKVKVELFPYPKSH